MLIMVAVPPAVAAATTAFLAISSAHRELMAAVKAASAPLDRGAPASWWALCLHLAFSGAPMARLTSLLVWAAARSATSAAGWSCGMNRPQAAFWCLSFFAICTRSSVTKKRTKFHEARFFSGSLICFFIVQSRYLLESSHNTPSPKILPAHYVTFMPFAAECVRLDWLRKKVIAFVSIAIEIGAIDISSYGGELGDQDALRHGWSKPLLNCRCFVTAVSLE